MGTKNQSSVIKKNTGLPVGLANNRNERTEPVKGESAHAELGERLATIFNDRLDNGLTSEEVVAEWEGSTPESIVARFGR